MYCHVLPCTCRPSYVQEKPGLRLMQYKSMIFDRWQKDPRNPRNQRVEK